MINYNEAKQFFGRDAARRLVLLQHHRLGVQHAADYYGASPEHWGLFECRFPRTAAWIRQCYHKPSADDIALECANDVLDLYGTEAIGGDCDETPDAVYCSTGDAYALTVLSIQEWSGAEWYLGSMGDCLAAIEADCLGSWLSGETDENGNCS